MKMSEKTLLNKIERAFEEHYDNGSYEVKVDCTSELETCYTFVYTYETGETIALHIDVTRLGEVKFYSPVHQYYISNFSKGIKSVINVFRMLFDLIECNTKEMINYYEIEEETEETLETADFDDNDEYEELLESSEEPTAITQHEEIDTFQPHIHIDTDNIKYLMETHSFPSTPTHEPTSKKVRTSSIYGMFGGFPSILDMYNDKCFCCPADRQGNRCCGEKWCKETWKRYEAIIKPEWHNVSLATLANLDIDMLDEKRQTYLTAFRDLQQTLSYLRKCKTQDTYDTCFIRYIRRKNVMYAENKISRAMLNYIEAKLSMQNVESGVWASECEEATGYHDSRRYNKSRVGR